MKAYHKETQEDRSITIQGPTGPDLLDFPLTSEHLEPKTDRTAENTKTGSKESHQRSRERRQPERLCSPVTFQ